MPIWGIITNGQGTPVQEAAVIRMAEVFKQGSSPYSQCIGPESAAGFVSQTGDAYRWCSSNVTVVCDADLLNREELSRECELGNNGNVANLLGNLYQRFGMRLLERLSGSFALAIWDKSLHSCFLASDRFGIKSLSFATYPGGICFASRASALFASGLIKQEVDSTAIIDYLTFFAIPLPKSAFMGVSRVAPGTFIEWKERGLAVQRYWDLVYSEDARGSVDELGKQLLGEMEGAVRSASRGVPRSELGCFLSGGTDSSSIVGLLTKLEKPPINTFSIGFEERRFDELHYAHIAARHFRSNHREMIPGPEDTYKLIPHIVDAYDEPFANSSAVPAYFCLRLARDSGVKTMLAGDGGDELFGGNERYCTHQMFEFYQRFPAQLRKKLIEPLVFSAAGSVWPLKKVGRYISRSNTPNPERYFAWSFFESFPLREVMADSSGPDTMGELLGVPRAYYDSACARSELNRLLYIDIKMTLGDSDLPKVVGMAELAGVNVRFPYLDHKLAEFSGRLPAKLKVSGLEKRYLFKRATRRLLPAEILKKRKHGFGLPIGMWLKENPLLRGMAEDVLLDPRSYQRGYLRREFITSLFSRMDQDATPYYGDILWVLLMLELWHRRHVSGGKA